MRRTLAGCCLLVVFALFPLFFASTCFGVERSGCCFFVVLANVLIVTRFLVVVATDISGPPRSSGLRGPGPGRLCRRLSFVS